MRVTLLNICMVTFRVRISRLSIVIRPSVISRGGETYDSKDFIDHVSNYFPAGDRDDNSEAVVRAPQTQTLDSYVGLTYT